MNTGNAKTIHYVSAVFKLIDDFTGKAITDSITAFFVNNQRILPVRKADGIYVLTNLHMDNVSIYIQSPNYCPYVIDNFVQSLNGENTKIIPIRLHPGVNYPLRNGTTAYSADFVCASGKPLINTGIQLFAPFCNDSVKFKALKNINGVNAILVTNPKGLDFTGLTLTVPASKPSSVPVIFNIISKIDNMTFEIYELPEKQKPLEESIVKRVYSSFTNNNGQVLIPLEVSRSNLGDSCNSDKIALELYVCASEQHNKLSKDAIHKEILIKPERLTHFKEEFNI